MTKIKRLVAILMTTASMLILATSRLASATGSGTYRLDHRPWETLQTTAPWEREITGVEYVAVEPKGAESIASIAGHAFVRLVDSGPAADNWTIGFTVDVYDENGDARPMAALSGLGVYKPYPLTVEIRPLRQIGDHYALFQNRTMKRHVVPMTPEQREAFVARVKELWERDMSEEGIGKYRFLTQNCTTEISKLFYHVFGKHPFLKPKRDREDKVLPSKFPRELAEYGLVLPQIGTVTAESTDKLDYEANWARLDRLYTTVDSSTAGADIDAWVAEAYDRLGRGWVKDMARKLRKKAYRRAYPDGFRTRIAAEFAEIQEQGE